MAKRENSRKTPLPVVAEHANDLDLVRIVFRDDGEGGKLEINLHVPKNLVDQIQHEIPRSLAIAAALYAAIAIKPQVVWQMIEENITEEDVQRAFWSKVSATISNES